ncbi:Homocysteine S-methyltransferase [Pseudocercospora fuligena]|uniref:Homocysteine S-methyltransferase n=1 Tax=Pseudocercospora fuligena TaxID=685502 RepID=A0A8H6R7E2_9PEZI|nr:Homocysteine S-methyltransferase [Pseudocercospora fuligena]
MLSRSDFQALLDSEGLLIVDGALATELETRGHDLNHPLWSAKLLKESPASIEDVHFDYFKAGANIAITASYQAGIEGLTTHFGVEESEARLLIKRSVGVAQAARDALAKPSNATSPHGSPKTRLIAGSVGPYGAFLADGSEYRGDYQRTLDEFKDFHRSRIETLIEAGVDLLALETMPNMAEIQALLELLQTEFPHAIAWLSCSMKGAAHLSDGTPWQNVLDLVNEHQARIVSFGINCVPLHETTDALEQIKRFTDLPLICYPNSGEVWESATHTWHGSQPDALLAEHSGKSKAASQLAADFDSWTKAGARLVGGCCRTGPAFIAAIHNHLKE